MNPTIKFSHNWNNKLNNEVFTTIRTYSQEKWKYYIGLKDKIFDVVLNGKKIREVKLIRIDNDSFDLISEYLLVLDTGETSITKVYEIFRKFGLKNADDKMIILTFRDYALPQNKEASKWIKILNST